MSKENCIEHFLLGDLVCTCLYHHDGILCACNGEMESAPVALLGIGVDDIIPVHIADAYRADGACKRSFADGKRK